MAKRSGLCSVCATSRISERRKSICLKRHGVHGGLPCSQCGAMTPMREYDPKKEPSPYGRAKRAVPTSGPVKMLYLDAMEHQVEEEHDE